MVLASIKIIESTCNKTICFTDTTNNIFYRCIALRIVNPRLFLAAS